MKDWRRKMSGLTATLGFRIGKDSRGDWGITFQRNAESWSRYSIVRAKPDERQAGPPIRLGTGDQRSTTLTIAGWHLRRLVRTRHADEPVRTPTAADVMGGG